MSSTNVSRRVNAPRQEVYRALLDRHAVPVWMVPKGMSCEVHEFDPREGGAFRVSLTYEDGLGTGKTTGLTDTYRGRFVRLVPNHQVIRVAEFETDDPGLRGTMTITMTLQDAGGATDVIAVHEGLPPGVSPADNVKGWESSLGRLAALVEGAPPS